MLGTHLASYELEGGNSTDAFVIDIIAFDDSSRTALCCSGAS